MHQSPTRNGFINNIAPLGLIFMRAKNAIDIYAALPLTIN